MNEEDNKYEDNDDENEDYFSCSSGIGAIKFRKRLQQLQAQSKKLENLQFQLLSIKNANYINELNTICAISIIQPIIRNNINTDKATTTTTKKKKNKSSHKVVFNLFTENETKRAFIARNNNNSFPAICHSYWKDTHEANNSLLTLSYQLVETPYTLFTKILNNKSLIFLIVGTHNSEQIKSYRIVDILQSMIVDLCTSLQINSNTTLINNKDETENDEEEEEEKENKKDKPKRYENRKMSLTAMIEILEEVFGGSGDDVYPLNETEFVTCMRVRIGMFLLLLLRYFQILFLIFFDGSTFVCFFCVERIGDSVG